MADMLPRASLLRVIKATLPDGYRLDTDAKIGISNGVTAFILCVTSLAQDVALKNKRRTLLLADVLMAIEQLGLDHFVSSLESTVPAKKAKSAPKQDNAARAEDGMQSALLAATEEAAEDAAEDEDASLEKGDDAGGGPSLEDPTDSHPPELSEGGEAMDEN